MVRFGISLPEWYERRLKIWAKWKGTNRATLASNIVQARIEANWDEISAWMNQEAGRRGVSVEEFEAELLNGDDDD